MEDFENPVFSRNVLEFVTVANEFCKFLETSEEFTLTKFVDAAHKVLPLLYMKAAMLPKFEESFEEFNEKFVSEEEYNFIQNNLQIKFGEYNTYDEIYDPLRQENDEPAQLSLAENFADMYQDLKDFLMQYRNGTNEVMQNAVWECRQAFEQYWGQRLVNALRVLHHLIYYIVDLETEDKQNETQSDEPDYDKIDTKNWFISRMQEDFRDEE